MSKQEKEKLEAIVAEASGTPTEIETTKVDKKEAPKKEKRSMSQSKKRRIVNTASYITLSIICVVWVLPFVFLLLQSFRVESFGPTGYIFPKKWGFDNYVDLFTKTSFPKWVLNTFLMLFYYHHHLSPKLFTL